jgi:hypothetical protein
VSGSGIGINITAQNAATDWPFNNGGNVAISAGTGFGVGAHGNVGIGTTAPGFPFHLVSSQGTNFVGGFINGANSTTAHGVWITAGSNSAGGAVMPYFLRPDGSVIGCVQQSSATSVGYNTTSDERIKENVPQSAVYREGLDYRRSSRNRH